MTVSFTVTAFHEMSEIGDYGRKLQACIAAAQQHEAITEIVIVDDNSDDSTELKTLLQGAPKVRLYQNAENQGVFGNKLEAVALSEGDWVINCDSDNTMDIVYLDKAISLIGNERTWHSATFARPNFDYLHLAGCYALEDMETALGMPRFGCLLNTGNQIVCREQFLRVFAKYRGQRFDLSQPNYLNLTEEERSKHYWRLVWDACDSFFFNMEWLLNGGKLNVARGLEYDHHYSAGPDSNYARAPEEKERLADILTDILRKAAGCH